MYTIVTAFFDIGRSQWTDRFSRSNEKYLAHGKVLCSLDVDMVIWTESKFQQAIEEYRSAFKNRTKIITTSLHDLPMYKFYPQFKNIMESDDYKTGLTTADCPEVCHVEYDILMFSKPYFVAEIIRQQIFSNTYYVWCDFGNYMFKNPDSVNVMKQQLDNYIHDELTFLCRQLPTKEDLNIREFYKSHSNRLAATLFSGAKHHMLMLEFLIEQEVQECLKQNVLDSDQSLFGVIFLKYPHLFRFYFGDWDSLFDNYHSSEKCVVRS